MELISIIIPAWREGSAPGELAKRFMDLPKVEVIISLCLEDTQTVRPKLPRLKVVEGAKGRAVQMNSGAREARGDVLLFLHADTSIEPGSLNSVREAMARQDVAGGAYRLAIDSPKHTLKLVEAGANLRSRFLKMPYGDQAIFVRKTVFDGIGGYEDVPLMEDVRLITAMKRRGKVVILSDAARTSARRWEREGVWRRVTKNLALITLHQLGVSPQKLADYY
ncbi:MAG: TIGR04283 family arsenosugar biosynthesis glycosyltransferase [Nitrospinae bacterium]|nr:TIGR04283 family arsenosugar biosynthesis glycosyltransferase [Nitrospinota bacterium]